MRPPVVGWGEDDGSFPVRFGWQGTRDPAAFLAVPAAIDFQAEHAWDEVRSRCHALAEEGRLRLAELTGIEPIAPDERWLGQMVATRLPDCDAAELKRRLYDDHRIEIPVEGRRGQPIVRASFQAYNDGSDLDTLLAALRRLL